MSGFWNPSFWTSLGVPGVLSLMAVAFVIALGRGWIVLGKQHDAVVARAAIDAESVQKLSLELAGKNGAELLATQILTSLRDSVSKDRT